MAERSDSKGFIYFVLGALVVGVCLLGYFLWYKPSQDPGVSVTVTEDGVNVESTGGN